MVPHMMRPLAGRLPGGTLLPSALAGAALLLAADIVARLAPTGPELKRAVLSPAGPADAAGGVVILAASSVRLNLGGRPVLCGVDAAVRPGELLGLIGANGAGKSTLLRVLAGLRRPDAGEVRLDGTGLNAIPPARLALARAYLPQEPTAHWALSVEELVGLGRLPHRRTGPEAAGQAAIARALRRTGTLEFARRRIDALSGGERARVLLARALAVEAPILLADEPIAGLDPLQQIRTMHVLRALAAEGSAV